MTETVSVPLATLLVKHTFTSYQLRGSKSVNRSLIFSRSLSISALILKTSSARHWSSHKYRVKFPPRTVIPRINQNYFIRLQGNYIAEIKSAVITQDFQFHEWFCIFFSRIQIKIYVKSPLGTCWPSLSRWHAWTVFTIVMHFPPGDERRCTA